MEAMDAEVGACAAGRLVQYDVSGCTVVEDDITSALPPFSGLVLNQVER